MVVLVIVVVVAVVVALVVSGAFSSTLTADCRFFLLWLKVVGTVALQVGVLSTWFQPREELTRI